MNHSIEIFIDFIKNEDGTTAIEYALLCSLISVAIVGTMPSLVEKINNAFITIRQDLNTVG